LKNSSGALSVHEARTALGQRLRELRRQAGLTGVQLAESLSWPQSKVSKLETARQTPTEQDIREWAQATGNEPRTGELLTALQTLEARHAEWERLLNQGHGPLQRKTLELDKKTRLFRVFEESIVPGMLQTADYARSVFAQGVALHRVVNDVEAAVQARMQRQELLYRQDKRFHFVITESVLRIRYCESRMMLAQLDRLVSLLTLPNVRLGIIGFETRYVVGPRHGFWLRDNNHVAVETFSASLQLNQPSEIELYGRAFEALATVASYDRAARAIIARVAEDLTLETS
jgi:transcriptional regulator with XRE-family HTH domain